MVEAYLTGSVPGRKLHPAGGLEKAVDGALGDGVTHGDVNAVVLAGDGGEKGHKELFIGEDEDRLFRGAVDLGEDARSKLCLSDCRRNAHDSHVGTTESVGVQMEGLREFLDILFEEERSPVTSVADFL